MQANIISVGDELIRGETVDTNAAYAARALVAQGVEIAKIIIVSDDLPAIAEAIGEGIFNLIGGGLGGTHDDITRQGIARKTGLELIEHPAAWAKAEAYLQEEFPNRVPPDSVLKVLRRMALVPRGAQLVDNPAGAAPGFIVHEPIFILALPGVPAEFKATFENALRELDLSHEPEDVRGLLFPLPEAMLQEAIQRTLQRFPQIRIGSYPKWDEKHLTTEIRFRSNGVRLLEEAVAFFQEQIGHTA